MRTSKNILTEKEMELVGLLMQDCQSTGDIQTKLKRLFAGTIEQMLESEMEEHLGYEKHSVTYNKNGVILSTMGFRDNIECNKLENEYDGLDRLIYRFQNAVRIETLKYDNNHNQTLSIDALDNETSFAYDKNNRLLSTTDPLLHTSGHTYNNAGFVATKYDGKNNTTSYEYDEIGRLKFSKQIIDSYTETTAFTHDLNNNLLTQTNRCMERNSTIG